MKLFGLFVCALIVGCQPAQVVPAPLVVRTSSVEKVPPPAVKRGKPVTQRKANHSGKVMVLEYHRVEATESRWARSTAKFRTDLERLYRLGYRPITLSEYLSGKFSVPAGATPVVFTFDDGHPSQFTMLPDGSIDPTCMVAIWRKFAETRPDFPVKATFFVLPPQPFAQKKFAQKKVDLLKQWGSEIGIHTLHHRDLSKLTDEQVKKEIGGSIDWLRQYGVEARTMAMPYGVYPKNRSLLKQFKWNGKVYSLDGAVRVGAVPVPAPGSKDILRWGIPRIQGIDADYGLHFWMNATKKGVVKAYVQ